MWKCERKNIWGAAIARWIRLRLPSSRPGFESQSHHLCFFQFIKLKLCICHLNWNKVQIVYLSLELECEKNENKQKEAGLAHFYKMSILQLYLRRVVINNRKALQIGHREV